MFVARCNARRLLQFLQRPTWVGYVIGQRAALGGCAPKVAAFEPFWERLHRFSESLHHFGETRRLAMAQRELRRMNGRKAYDAFGKERNVRTTKTSCAHVTYDECTELQSPQW